MAVKVLVSTLVVLSMLLCSCYPELSVQQYDKLKKELEDLDTERKELHAEVRRLEIELAMIKNKNADTLDYVEFLDKLIFTPSLGIIVSGEFDVEALADSATKLKSYTERLGDSEIDFYLGLINPEHRSQSIAAYYKIVEICLKKTKQNLK